MRIKTGLFILLMGIFISCQKKVQTQSRSQNKISKKDTVSNQEESLVQTSYFDINGAKVYEKAGRKEEVTELLDQLLFFNLIDRNEYSILFNQNNKDSLNSNFKIARSLNNIQIIHSDSISGE